jgi:hypothetical protein
MADFQIVITPWCEAKVEALGSPVLPGYTGPFTYPKGWVVEGALRHLRRLHLIN